jgi:DNA repair exonuclease SbcCD nuclease subunit
MKVLAVGDAHCKVGNISDIRLLQAEIIKIIESEAVDLCVILGDLHDTFEKVHVLAYSAIVDLLKAVSSIVKTVYVVGNHDMVNNSGFLHEDHFFKPMKSWDQSQFNLTIADSVVSDSSFVFCPYVPPGRFVEALNTADGWQQASAIFCHQEFRNAKMGAVQSRNGDEWTAEMPLVVSGHIHDYDWLSPNILYVGSPLMTSFGDSGKKTVSLISFESDRWDEVRIEIEIPKKVTLSTTLDEIDSIDIPPNCAALRIKIEGPGSSLTAFKKTGKYKELASIAKVICVPNDSVEIARSGICRQSYLEILRKTCQQESELVLKLLDQISQ